MKKKWTYLAVAGMLLGTAPVFTGCVDNDEPAGIEQLRGAKAQLLQAKATVEEARAQWILADAQYQEALARHENALAAAAEYEAEKRRLEAELMEAKNEKEKIYLQQEIQRMQEEMEENALEHQKQMLKLQMQLAEVQRNYELVMEQLKIAEAIGSEKTKVTISELKAEVQRTYAKLYGGNYVTVDGDEESVDKKKSLYYLLEVAQEAVYNATLDQAHGIVSDDPEAYIPLLEYRVAEAQAIYDAEKEAEAKFSEFLSKDAATTDWRAEIESLENEIETVKKNWEGAKANVEKVKNSGTYLAAYQKLYGVYAEDAAMGDLIKASGLEGTVCKYPSNWDDAVEYGAYQDYKQAVQDLNKLKRTTEFTLAEVANPEEGTDVQLTSFLDRVAAAMDPAISVDWANLGYQELKYKFYFEDATSGEKNYTELDVANNKYPNPDVHALFVKFQNAQAVLTEAAKQNMDSYVKLVFEDMKEWVDDTYKALSDQVAKDYTDTFSAAEKTLTDAETALLAADKEMAVEKAKVKDLEADVAKWYNTYDAYSNIRESLIQAVVEVAGIGWPIEDGVYLDTDEFEKYLQKQALIYQKEVVKAEKQLADAQVELEKAKNGKYNAVYYAQAELNIASYNFNLGWEAYQEALNNLELGLAAIADEEEGGSAEQPGDDNQDPAGEEEQPAE